MWKEHFKNLLGNSPITKIIINQLDIKLEQFTQELIVVPTRIKIRKAVVFGEIPTEVGRQGNLMTYCSDSATSYITRTL